MIYYIAKKRSSLRHAGGKAPNDIYELCEQKGWKKLEYPESSKDQLNKLDLAIRKLQVRLFWRKTSRFLKKGDIVFYQHPMRYGTKDARKAILKLQEKGVRFFALIHDLDSLRQSMVYAEGVSSNVLFEDNDFLKVFDRIICHNASMQNYLVSKGFDAEKLICLNLFDYLIPDEVSENKNQSGLVVAGNLSEKKCPYIYLLADDLNQEPLRAYGLNFNASANPKGNIDYCGSFTPEELPAKLQGRFGVIWDGTSIDSCEGAAGGYLRYNNPHKLSLYIASSLPVIAWSEAAIAPLIQKEHIGITVDSLRNVEAAIGKISEEEYREMKKNLEGLRRKVIRGEFFSIAAERAISELSKETM